jgi:hypothetical protein
MSIAPRSSTRPPLVSLLGMLFLSYLLGAGAMHFHLPTSDFLREAFDGGQAWCEPRPDHAARPALTISHVIDKFDKTCDGFTLFTTNDRAEARLIDMHGDTVHRWAAPFRQVWPLPRHVRKPVADTYFFACHLFANGDLLAVYHGMDDTPYGYGLAKLDRDSHVLWTYAAHAHHAVDVAEDGSIYVLTQEMLHERPAGLDFLTLPALVDHIAMLSPEGKELKKISLVDAFRESPYALLLHGRDTAPEHAWDPMHANQVEVLTSATATHFPEFKAGQMLISLRELDALAVIDPASGKVVWAARGPWRAQHDPHFLDNGRILLFDNRGLPGASRVLEYDPQTQALPWSYASEDSPPFLSGVQGNVQRLSNGNTLINNAVGGTLMEVTADHELVWSCWCQAHLSFARRYAPEHLPFLNGTAHAR